MKNLPPIDPQSYEPLREQVYRVLRRAILTGQLKPRDPVTEVGIAEQLKVSRTPAREAIRMLEQEGLIVIVPRKGAFVTGILSSKEITDLFQVRILLEGLATELAAERISPEQLRRLQELTGEISECINNEDIEGCIRIDTTFHKIICEASQNEWLQRILDSLFEQVTRFRAASLSSEGRLQEALDEHRQLAAAIAEGNPKRARQLAVTHLENAQNYILTVFRKQQSGE